MTRDEHLIKLALKVAAKSQHKFPMGAIIAAGNRILAFGINKYRTHPQQINHYTNDIGGSIHAELDAIISCCNSNGATIYIARLFKDGTAGMAKPCVLCQNIIETAGIKKVVFTTRYGIDIL